MKSKITDKQLLDWLDDYMSRGPDGLRAYYRTLSDWEEFGVCFHRPIRESIKAAIRAERNRK